MKKGINAEDWLSKLLLEAIRGEIDSEIVKSIKDPCYKNKLEPMKFESKEVQEKFKTHFDKVWDTRNDFLKDEEE